MFGHAVFGVSNYEDSKTFFLLALRALAVGVISEEPLGLEVGRSDIKSSLCIRRVEEKAAHLHPAFRADSRQQVNEFHEAALAAGAKDDGSPGLRPQYHSSYYAAFVAGPDRHNIEAVCHEAAAQSVIWSAPEPS